MKRLLSILIIAALMLPGLMRIGIIIDFKINQDFIAEVLCINREEPISTCSGKCYLSEQLRQVDEQEEKQAPVSGKVKLEVVHYLSGSTLDFSVYKGKNDPHLNPFYSDGFYNSSFITDVFHPPKHNLI